MKLHPLRTSPLFQVIPRRILRLCMIYEKHWELEFTLISGRSPPLQSKAPEKSATIQFESLKELNC
jgi:hypothetical protein